MSLKFEKVVVMDFFVGGFGEKARFIKNRQNMKNGYQFFTSLASPYRLALA